MFSLRASLSNFPIYNGQAKDINFVLVTKIGQITIKLAYQYSGMYLTLEATFTIALLGFLLYNTGIRFTNLQYYYKYFNSLRKMQCLQWDWLPGPIILLVKALPTELLENSTNTVSRGDSEPITVSIILEQQDLSHCKPQLS